MFLVKFYFEICETEPRYEFSHVVQDGGLLKYFAYIRNDKGVFSLRRKEKKTLKTFWRFSPEPFLFEL